MAITIDLDEPKLTVLKNEAASLGIAVEQLASAIIQRHLARSSAGNEAFRKAMTETFDENDELYRRLAR